jgi:hypothetical protein
MLLGLYLLMVIALPVALGSYVVFNGLPRSRRCPSCAAETLRLQSRLHAAGSRFMRHGDVQLRWCMACGWRGTARTSALPVARLEPTSRSAAMGHTGRADRVDVRAIDVNGAPWRVMVECWAEGGRWLARLVFVAPGGQSWADERLFEGDSAVAVISQAFSLPEPILAGRLRRTLR